MLPDPAGPAYHSSRGWLTLKASAAYTEYTERTLRRYIADGKLKAYRVNRQIRIRAEDLDAIFTRIPNGS